MEYIKTLEDAREYVEGFFKIEDLIVTWGVDEVSLMEAGFDPDGEGKWVRDDMKCITKYHRHYTNCRFVGKIGEYDAVISMEGNEDDDTMEIVASVDLTHSKFDIFLTLWNDHFVNLYDITIFDREDWSKRVKADRTEVSVLQPYEDLDGDIISCETRYNHGNLTTVSYKNALGFHCFSGPAYSVNGKNYHYIDGHRYHVKEWERRRDSALARK